MNKATRKHLTEQLAVEQKGARVRTLTAEEVIDIATTIETFLRRKTTPVATAVTHNWARVANSYKGVPHATFVYGRKTLDGVSLQVIRSAGGFGNRDWTVSAPHGYVVRGPAAHGSGATDDLLTTKIEKRED